MNKIFNLANKMEKYGKGISENLRDCANNWNLGRRTEKGEFTNGSDYEEILEYYRKEAASKGNFLLEIAKKNL